MRRMLLCKNLFHKALHCNSNNNANETVNSTTANQHGRARNQARIGASIAARPTASSDKQFSARERREKLGRGAGKPNSKPPDMNDPYGIDIAECLRKSNRPRWGTQTFKIIQTKYDHYSFVISGLKVYS